MSSDDGDRSDHTRIANKGKGRATAQDVSETTPLLASSSGLHIEAGVPPRRRRLVSKLVSVFLISASFCLLLFVLALLIAWSYGSQASALSPEDLQRAVRFRGPYNLDVEKVSESGIWLTVRGRVGVDAGEVIGVKDDEDDNIISYLWKSLGRWSIHRVHRITVQLSPMEAHSDRDFLANVSMPMLELPLTANPPPDETWLTELSIPLFISPTHDADAVIRFVRESWRDGFARTEVVIPRVLVHGGPIGDHTWRSRLKVRRSWFRLPMRVKIPPVPGLPPPGHNDPLPSPSRLVSLKSFNIETSNDHSSLLISAEATAVNPLPDTIHYSPPKLPFIISLPSVKNSTALIPVATVHSAPFNLTHPNVSLSITGTVLPLAQNASSTVSTLLANYISLRDSDISIKSPLLPYFTVDAVFPAKRPKPEILRNVTIRDMKIMPTTSGSSMLASGTIYARVVLPNGINPNITVTKVLPDVLIFDGEVPANTDQLHMPGDDDDDDTGGDDLPPPQPLPDPLPERAFAHIRPDEWIPAVSVSADADEGDGTTVEVFAKVVDLPLEVLPGRDREFRNFVGKVIFNSQGALAGVLGVTAVAVRIDGLAIEEGDNGGEMQLDGLPFQGTVRIGKRGSFLGFET